MMLSPLSLRFRLYFFSLLSLSPLGFLAEEQVILKSNMLPHHFWAISRDIHTTPKTGRTILHIVLSCESILRQIAQHHLSHQRMKIVVIRKIILAAVFHFSLRQFLINSDGAHQALNSGGSAVDWVWFSLGSFFFLGSGKVNCSNVMVRCCRPVILELCTHMDVVEMRTLIS